MPWNSNCRLTGGGGFLFFGLTLIVAVLTYALALIFIFPGKFQPIAIPHSDIYMPLAIANSPFNWGMPRPTGSIIDAFRGRFGLEFSVLFPVCVAFANCVGTVLLVRKIFFSDFDIRKNILSVFLGLVVYFWLIFTHRYFYIFAGWDAYAQYSYFFLLLSVAWLRLFWKRFFVGVLGFFLSACVAFLSKETYALSFFVVLPFVVRGIFVSGSAHVSGHTIRDRLVPRVVVVSVTSLFAFLVALGVNRYLNSPFTGHNLAVNGAYQISLSPMSIMGEWVRYAKDGFNVALGTALFVVAGFFLLRAGNRRNALPLIVPVIAGGLSWLPNSLLPNHHFAQYSFTGSYLYYLPFLFIVAGWPQYLRSMRNLRMGVAIFLVALPFLNLKLFRSDIVQFYTVQMDRQIEYNDAVKSIARNPAATEGSARNLLVGIAPPFNPFIYPSAFLKGYFPNGISLDVVGYSLPPGEIVRAAAANVSVRLLDASEVDLDMYKTIWSVGLDGGGFKKSTPQDYIHAAQVSGISIKDLVLYPEVGRIFLGRPSLSEKEFLDCGLAFKAYGANEKSLVCFDRSIQMAPNNPYPYFFYALALEPSGDIKAAVIYMEKANSLEPESARNPMFQAELRRLKKGLTN
ncbi:tetratricopeptide repeat protein [Pseudorhodoferax soli]|uniref:Uncharacterized protein n=1 Tax=Pseudorhodoferax soli TaxID=545864 RepID=A0A368XMV1_9BURK|nr:tetratricopeptide repeat protein [Pseudorhodoferax soli]RCW67354.1 hypothetical protein DES41_10977 [Pseudorhodoferax soli]